MLVGFQVSSAWAQEVPLEARVHVTQTITLELSSCSSCYIKAYLVPKNVRFKQNVVSRKVTILEGNCKYRILYDNYSNPYILFTCKNTTELAFQVTADVLRFYTLTPSSDIDCSKNLNYYVGPAIFYMPEYRMALNKVSENYCVANLYYYLKYIVNNFQYNLNLSSTTLKPPEVLYRMQGNCDEIAWLVAEIARNFYVPAKYVLGIWLQQTGALYHAWTEIWIRSGWYDVDLLAKEYGFVDADHIYLAEFYSPVPPISASNASIISESYSITYSISNVSYKDFLGVKARAWVEHQRLRIEGLVNYSGYLPESFRVLVLLDNSSIYSSTLTIDPGETREFNLSLPLRYLGYGKHTLQMLVVDELFHSIYSRTLSFVIYPEPKIVIEKAYYRDLGDRLTLNLWLRNIGSGVAKNLTVMLVVSNYSGFICSDCAQGFDILRPNQTVLSNLSVKSELPLLPKEMIWPVQLQYSSLNNETFLYTFNILVIYLENPKEKLLYLALGLIIFSVLLWLMNKVKYAI